VAALPAILNCSYEPFSFQMLSKFFKRPIVDPEVKVANFQEVSFCQNIKNRETILFNDKREEITLID
jgi:hypothetical protein